MSRFSVQSVYWAAAAAVAVFTMPTEAHAEIKLYDKDGWGFSTQGLIAAHYQLIEGDGDPDNAAHGVLVGGQFNRNQSQDSRKNHLLLSRVHSGFIGTQIGFGVKREINEQLHVDSLMAVSLVDISNDRKPYQPKQVDFREAWASLVSDKYGAFKFGRMFSIFGSASAPVVTLAYQYGVGNPCLVEGATIACASVGAGPLYAGFDAQMRYISPRLFGLEAQVAVSDPIGGRAYRMTPQPRFDAELNYDHNFTPDVRLRVIGQGMSEQLERITPKLDPVTGTPVTPTQQVMQKERVWGVMGATIVEAYGAALGLGAWTGAGIGPRTVLESDTNDFGYDANGKMRKFKGFFGNASYTLFDITLAAGGGMLLVDSTKVDKKPGSGINVLAQAREMHATLAYKLDAITFIVEYMNWKSKWYWNEKSNQNFGGGGVNFTW